MFTVKVNNEWECFSGEDYQWNLLIERLEQLCHLNATLKCCLENPVGTLHCIKYEYSPITLSDLLKHGRGNTAIESMILLAIFYNNFNNYVLIIDY